MICPGCGKRVPDDGFALCAECDAKRGISHERHTEETVADIVAMLRANARGERFDNFSFTSLADRIEAAWKREKSQSWHHREMEELILRHEKEVAELKNQTGNAAAIRKALEGINRINTIGLKRLLVELVEADIFDGGLINKTISIVEKARAALSDPPRNCDRFTDGVQAYHAFAEETKSGMCDQAFFVTQWLFGTAKKGGTTWTTRNT